MTENFGVNLYSNGNLTSPFINIDKKFTNDNHLVGDVIESTQQSTWRQIWNESNSFGWQMINETGHRDFR